MGIRNNQIVYLDKDIAGKIYFFNDYEQNGLLILNSTLILYL